MTVAPPRVLPTARQFTVYSVVSAGLGVLVVLIMGIGREELYSARSFGAGALLGLCLNTGAILCEAGTFRLLRIDRDWNPLTRRALSTVAYFGGGMLGYLTARAVARLLNLHAFDLDRDGLSGLPVFGLVTVIVGATFGVVRLLQRRLARSVSRLKEKEHAERELETARALQRRLLPPSRIEGRGYVIEARNLAAEYVAGDFYDVFPLPGHALGIAVGDVSGKGMAASLLMASVKAMLPLLAADRSVAATLDELNRRLELDLDRREFVALSFARFDPASGLIELGNAGLPNPYLLGGSVTEIVVPGPRLPLGARRDVHYETTRLVLEAGESLLLLSDGLPEAPDPDGNPLGYEKLRDLLVERDLASGPWLDRLLGAIGSRSRGRPEDDWTLLLLERLAPGS